jgi:uncharacterized protein YeeX (DUF496 family)
MLLLPNFKQAIKRASSLEEIGTVLIECADEIETCCDETKSEIDDFVTEQANRIIKKLNPQSKKKVVGFLI